ncbi:MAG: rhomboid family intramembrane serine protease [Lachnospiraceae bacterium]|nr:rhomboid family intramembrane serine protease [Lachnospiraceae bacterium]
MYKDFAINAALDLISEEFRILGDLNINRIEEKTEDIILFKNLSPIIYVVALINADVLDVSQYAEKSRNLAGEFNKFAEENHIGRLIYINVFAGKKNIADFFEFAKSKPYIPDAKPLSVFWCVDLESKKLLIPEGSADKILNIQDVLKRAINEEEEPKVELSKRIKKAFSLSELELKIKIPFLTYFIIAINGFVLIYMYYSGNEACIINGYAKNSQRIFLNGEYYRLFTSMFLHKDVYHLLYNAFSLYLFGTRCEKYMGRGAFAIIYLASGLAGGFLSSIILRGTSIGASAGVFGVLGALLALAKKSSRSVEGLTFFSMMVLALIGIAMGFLEPDIDNVAHLGGVISGFLIEFMILRKKNKKEYKD